MNVIFIFVNTLLLFHLLWLQLGFQCENAIRKKKKKTKNMEENEAFIEAIINADKYECDTHAH